MARKKTDRASWSDVKTTIAGLDPTELIKLIGDLYRLSKSNKDFLHARFSVGEDPLKPYKQIIQDAMYPDVMRDKPIGISRGKRAISDYSKAVGDIRGEAELMVFFAECGNRFTVDFGDIDENFYDALLHMYARAVDKVLELPEPEQGELRERLHDIVTSSSGIGWGYHDGVVDLYYGAFPDDEQPASVMQ